MPREKINPRYATVVYCFALIVRCFPRKETLSNAFHDQNSSFLQLAVVALTVSFLGKFLESSWKVSRRLFVYEISHSVKRYLLTYLVGKIISLNRFAFILLKRQSIFCILFARGIYSLCIYNVFRLLKLWMFLITSLIIPSRS